MSWTFHPEHRLLARAGNEPFPLGSLVAHSSLGPFPPPLRLSDKAFSVPAALRPSLYPKKKPDSNYLPSNLLLKEVGIHLFLLSLEFYALLGVLSLSTVRFLCVSSVKSSRRHRTPAPSGAQRAST